MIFFLDLSDHWSVLSNLPFKSGPLGTLVYPEIFLINWEIFEKLNFFGFFFEKKLIFGRRFPIQAAVLT